jgi:hypothetical protein
LGGAYGCSGSLGGYGAYGAPPVTAGWAVDKRLGAVRATSATKVFTLAMSAVANSWAMAHTADNMVMGGACVVAGVAIPALIALATFTLGKAVRA